MNIEYKFSEEIEFAKFYAKKLNDKAALSILESGVVKSAEEARHLSVFFWSMVNKSIEDHNNKVILPWAEGAEFWNEKLMYSFSGYLERSGFENEWEEVSDLQE